MTTSSDGSKDLVPAVPAETAAPMPPRRGPNARQGKFARNAEGAPRHAAPPDVAPATAGFYSGPIEMQSAQSRRLIGRMALATFALIVLLPLVLASVYYVYYASDRFAVEVKFAIRSPTDIATPDLLGLVSGAASSGSTQSDSYMVVDYLESRQFLDDLTERVDLKAFYATDKADFLTRMAADATKEDQVDYLPSVLAAEYASTSQIITVEVQAFTAENALSMARAVIESTSNLVNIVSERAREDTVRLAETELGRAEEALKSQRALIASFRETEQKIDPTSSVTAQESVLAQLQGELARILTEKSSLREFLSEDAPSVRVLQSQIVSIERQIAAERGQIGTGAAQGSALPGDENLNDAVARYEALTVDLEFRQRTYLSALASVEAARLEAVRQQRYVAAFVLPSLPEEAAYPRVLLNLFLLGVISFLIWGVLTMFVKIVREHLS